MISYVSVSVLLFCSFQVFAIELPDATFDEGTLKCMEEVKVDKKFLEEIFSDDFLAPKGNAKLNEFFECCAKQKGVFDENGKLIRSAVRTLNVNILLPALKKNDDKVEIANKIITECEEVQGDTLGDRVVNLHNCLANAARKL